MESKATIKGMEDIYQIIFFGIQSHPEQFRKRLKKELTETR